MSSTTIASLFVAAVGLGGVVWFLGVARRATQRVARRHSVPVVRFGIGPRHEAALEAFEQGDPTLLSEVLQVEAPATDRLMILQELADRAPPDAVRSWARDAPNDPSALLLASAVMLRLAVEARGEGTADTVTEQGAAGFAGCSAVADQLAQAAADLRPDDPIPWALRMRAAFALHSELEEHEALYQEAIARAPRSWAIHRTALNASCEKWFGSHGAMFELARGATDDPTDPLSMLIVVAHMERWQYLAYFDEDEAAADAYWSRKDVREEVERAFDAFLPAATASTDAAIARCTAAGWFFVHDDRERMVRAFGDDPIYFERAWEAFGGERAYREARLEAGA